MKYSSIFVFDNCKINIVTDNLQTLDYCSNYFDVFSKKISDRSTISDWIVEENVDKKDKWNVNLQEKKIVASTREKDGKFVMRVVRSLVILEDILHGRTMFKGSCFISNCGKGTVLVGPRRSGKTSILISCMFKKPQKSIFVSNSVFSMDVIAGELYAFGYPMSVGIRENVLRSMFKKGNDEVKMVLDYIQRESSGEDNRYYIEPQVLKNLLGGRIKKSTALDTVIIVKNIPSGQKSKIRKLSVNEARRYFEEYLTRYHNKKNGSWFNLFKIDMNIYTQTVDKFLSHGEYFELTYNVGSHKTAIKLINNI